MLDKWLSSYKHWANFILRSLVGVIFIAHGAQKLFGAFGGPGLEGAARYFEQLGFVPGDAWALRSRLLSSSAVPHCSLAARANWLWTAGLRGMECFLSAGTN